MWSKLSHWYGHQRSGLGGVIRSGWYHGFLHGNFQQLCFPKTIPPQVRCCSESPSESRLLLGVDHWEVITHHHVLIRHINPWDWHLLCRVELEIPFRQWPSCEKSKLLESQFDPLNWHMQLRQNKPLKAMNSKEQLSVAHLLIYKHSTSWIQSRASGLHFVRIFFKLIKITSLTRFEMKAVTFEYSYFCLWMF